MTDLADGDAGELASMCEDEQTSQPMCEDEPADQDERTSQDESICEPEWGEEAICQPMWRVKHHGADAIVLESSGEALVLFVYSLGAESGSAKFEEILVDMEKPPKEQATVGWFFHIDREAVAETCRTVPPPAGAKDSDDWLNDVIKKIDSQSLLFWKGDSEEYAESLGMWGGPVDAEPRRKDDVVPGDEDLAFLEFDTDIL